ncbi:hypothetical protein ABHI18_012339, partial [Aspergillus niger]
TGALKTPKDLVVSETLEAFRHIDWEDYTDLFEDLYRAFDGLAFAASPESGLASTPGWTEATPGGDTEASFCMEASSSHSHPPPLPLSTNIDKTLRARGRMAFAQPTFTGRAGENVNLYIDQCELMWLSAGLSDEDRPRAIATTLMAGLRNGALRYANTLEVEVQKDWNKLSNCLKTRFPLPKKQELVRDAMRQVTALRQGQRTLKEYAEEALEVSHMLSSKERDLLMSTVVDAFIEGLNRESAKDTLHAVVRERARREENVSLEDVIDIAEGVIRDGSKREQITGVKTKDERMIDALESITQRLEKMELSQGQRSQTSQFQPQQRPAQQQFPTAARQGPMATRICYRCGVAGHIAPMCTNEPLPIADQERIRNEARARQLQQNPQRPGALSSEPFASGALNNNNMSGNSGAGSGSATTVGSANQQDAGSGNTNVTAGPSSQRVRKPAPLSSSSVPTSSDSMPFGGRVNFVDVEEYGDRDSWNGFCHVVMKSQYMDVFPAEGRLGALAQLQRIFAAGESSRANPQDDTDSSMQDTVRPSEIPIDTTDAPVDTTEGEAVRAQKRHIQGLDTEPFNFRKMLNELKVEVSLAQLFDLAPSARTETSKLMKVPRQPRKTGARSQPRVRRRDKGKRPILEPHAPSKRVRIANMIPLIGQVSQGQDELGSDAEFDDCMQPKDPSASALFFATSIIQGMTGDNELRATKARFTLIDGGSTANLVPRHVVEKMRAKVVPISSTGEVASGEEVKFRALTWLMVSVAGANRIIGAFVVDGTPGFTLLLGRHWMHTVQLIGDYGKGTYSILQDNGQRAPLERSTRIQLVPPGPEEVEVSDVRLPTVLSDDERRLIKKRFEEKGLKATKEEILEMVHDVLEEVYDADSDSSEWDNDDFDPGGPYQVWGTIEEEIGGEVGYPVTERPFEFRRPLCLEDLSAAEQWMQENQSLIGDAVQESRQWRVVSLVLYTWRDLFVTDVRDMPVTRLVTHRIPTYPWVRPKASKLALYNQEEIEWQRTNLPPMVEARIIRGCISPWSAKTKFPPKPSGTGLRMVHQFIPLNAATIKSNYPMKRIEPILMKMAKFELKVFFKADAANGYWAVPLAEEHAYKTAFSTIYGQYCYLRMGQGLTGAPATYTRLKDIAMGAIPEPCSELPVSESDPKVEFDHFMDDDTGGAASVEDLLDFLHSQYFPRLAWARLTLNPKKTTFFTKQVTILGHQCTENGIRPSADKIAAIRSWPTPTDERSLLRFLNGLPFLRVYIPGRADLARTIKKALVYERKGSARRLAAFDWGPEQQRAFNKVKEHLARVTLSGGDPTTQYHLATDASNQGLGGVLFQIRGVPEGTRASRRTLRNEEPVMFMSFALTATETRYHTTEKETLAVLRCLEESRWLVKGSRFPTILYTDHTALKSVLGDSNNATGRIARWQYRLQEYDLEVIHVPGQTQVVADGLSRLPHWVAETNQEAEFAFPSFALEGLRQQQVDRSSGIEKYRQSPWYSAIMERLLSPIEDKGFAKRFALYDDRLCYQERNGQWSRCIMPDEVDGLLETLHDVHGHFSTRITLGRTIGRAYWPGRYGDIEEYCRSCHSCQMMGPKPSPSLPIKVDVLEPMALWGLDYIGPFSPPTRQGNSYIIVGVDYFSRFVVAEAVPRATAEQSYNFMQQRVVAYFGWPLAIYTDNGSHFTGKEFRSRIQRQQVKHMLAPTTAPWSVGLVERMVGLIVKRLRMMTFESSIDTWDEYLATAIYAINTRAIQPSGFVPAEVLLGFRPRLGLLSPKDQIVQHIVEQHWQDLQQPATTSGVVSRMTFLDEVRESAAVEQNQHQSNRKAATEYRVGDLVLVWRTTVEKDKGRKLDARWSGPFKVSKVSRHKRSVILSEIGTNLMLGRYHVDHLKLFLTRQGEALSEAKELAAKSRKHQRSANLLRKQSREVRRQ